MFVVKFQATGKNTKKKIKITLDSANKKTAIIKISINIFPDIYFIYM